MEGSPVSSDLAHGYQVIGGRREAVRVEEQGVDVVLVPKTNHQVIPSLTNSVN